MAIGKPATPIDFQAIDGRPVSVIWMLVSPPDKTGRTFMRSPASAA